MLAFEICLTWRNCRGISWTSHSLYKSSLNLLYWTIDPSHSHVHILNRFDMATSIDHMWNPNFTNIRIWKFKEYICFLIFYILPFNYKTYMAQMLILHCKWLCEFFKSIWNHMWNPNFTNILYGNLKSIFVSWYFISSLSITQLIWPKC